jgi:hypothetical protein
LRRTVMQEVLGILSGASNGLAMDTFMLLSRRASEGSETSLPLSFLDGRGFAGLRFSNSWMQCSCPQHRRPYASDCSCSLFRGLMRRVCWCCISIWSRNGRDNVASHADIWGVTYG